MNLLILSARSISLHSTFKLQDLISASYMKVTSNHHKKVLLILEQWLADVLFLGASFPTGSLRHRASLNPAY
jgi:hypothetical protein